MGESHFKNDNNKKKYTFLKGAKITHNVQSHARHIELKRRLCPSKVDQTGIWLSHDDQKLNHYLNYIFRGIIKKDKRPTSILFIERLLVGLLYTLISSHKILKTHWYYPYNCFMKKWWFQNNQFGRTTLATYTALHLEDSTLITIYLSTFVFLLLYLYNWSPLKAKRWVSRGVLISLLFFFYCFSSCFLKKKYFNNIKDI